MGGPTHLTLDGRRVLVVGASSGIGSAIADAAMAAGAHVALAARRVDRLEASIAAAAPRRGVAVGCDVRAPASVAPAVERAIDALGGLDALVYATGVNHLALLERTTSDAWALLFETNVVGAALVTAAALPALRSSSRVGRVGRVGLCSSHSVPDPWPGLVAYAATKAALDTMIHGWRAEEPEVAFTRIVVGPTMTPMAEAWDPAAASEFFARWEAEGRFVDVDPVEPALVAGEVLRWLADPVPPADLVMPNAGRG